MRGAAAMILGLLAALAACRAGDGADGDASRAPHVFSGGELGTAFNATSYAYEEPLPGLTDAELARHVDGDGLFDASFVTAPAPVFGGLGPLFNNTGCGACHVKEGRGSPAVGAGPQGSQMLVMVAMPRPASAPPGPPTDVPGVGSQVRDQAVFGATPNASVALEWVDEPPGELADGTPYQLRRPVVRIALADGSSLPDGVSVSLRQPLPVYGLGLIEAIPEAAIRQRADALDQVPGRHNDDPHRVPGRVNEVWMQAGETPMLGRFGRKAGVPSLRHQTAKAFSLDIGVSNEVFRSGEEPAGEPAELGVDDVELGAYYVRSLAVPARRQVDDPAVRHGEELFHRAGCSGCHAATWQTGDHEIQALSQQTIHPYSDLLLHDMGPGLADGRSEFAAGGQDWRTPALWGIGLATTVLPTATYLHDGRARSLSEAILWHGGQAAAAGNHFREMSREERAALEAFLRSL